MKVSQETIVKMVQARAQSLDSDYVDHIVATLELVYGLIAEQWAWSWMRAAETIDISIVSGTATYEIEEEKVQYVYDIQNADGLSIIGYRTYPDFVRERNQASNASVTTDFISLSLAQSSASMAPIFTDRGRSGQHLVIEIAPVPDTSFTAKLAYTEKGGLDNIEKMTPSCALTVIDGIMSIIGPPKEIKQGLWVGITQGSRSLFELRIRQLIAQEPLNFDYTPGLFIDPVLAERLNEI
jgi:hypothetical protein